MTSKVKMANPNARQTFQFNRTLLFIISLRLDLALQPRTRTCGLNEAARASPEFRFLEGNLISHRQNPCRLEGGKHLSICKLGPAVGRPTPYCLSIVLLSTV